ncbi:MAG TPA: type II toxin-antitoxin system PemK/MazF family toxin [Phycisphaerae bacterium]
MQYTPKIRQGEIYWIDNFPALDGQHAKRRPVIVLGHVDASDHLSPVLVVGISHTASTSERDLDKIQLPDLQQTPTAKTGLDRASWALPRWALIIEVIHFQKPVGHVKGELLRRIVRATLQRRTRANDAPGTNLN